MDQYLYFGSLGPHERQYQVPNFIGLALEPQHDREIRHDATAALPFESNAIAKVQSQDVFEHLPFEKVPFVLDEVYRVLKPGGVFRLSVPDYRSPVLKRRSVYDWRGRVTGDLLMGATTYFDNTTGDARVRFSEDGHAHIWFPRYELRIMQERAERIGAQVEVLSTPRRGTSVVLTLPASPRTQAAQTELARAA